ncbi:MAG: SIS domain-containing protein [Phycisphaerales bacterium JB037]
MSLTDAIQNALTEAATVVTNLRADGAGVARLAEAAERLAEVFQGDGRVLICGNGGSACDAMHFAEEFTGRFRKDRRALSAIAIADPAHLTCTANDFGFDEVFARAIEAHARAGDAVIVLSTSGNSANILRAIEAAGARGCVTLAFLGKAGGEARGRCDFEWIVAGETADRIQEGHMLLLHTLIECIERRLFPDLYAD